MANPASKAQYILTRRMHASFEAAAISTRQSTANGTPVNALRRPPAWQVPFAARQTIARRLTANGSVKRVYYQACR